MADDVKKPKKGDKVHGPLSSYFPPPFEVSEPTVQNFAPKYHGNGAAYVRNDEYPEKKES